MLKTLYIKNYAIIEQLEMEWHTGLSAITGETGAGKSIILGALQLALGARADAKVVGNLSEKCVVEICFTCKPDIAAEINSALDLDIVDEIIIRREVNSNGKSRTFLNDSPALLQDIQFVASKLISIHQQFDQLDFLDKENQSWILDCYAGILPEREKYKLLWKQYQNLQQDKTKLLEKKNSQIAEKDYLEFQLREFELLELKGGEVNGLEQEIATLSKSDLIKQNATGAHYIIDGEGGIIDQMLQVLSSLKNIQINENLVQLYNRLDQTKSEIQDCLHELENIAENVSADPLILEKKIKRLDLINRMMVKHQLKSEEGLVQYFQSAKKKMEEFENIDDSIQAIENKIVELIKELQGLGKRMSKERNAKVKQMVKETAELLRRMGLENARFEIEIQSTDQPQALGLDRIDFLFAANKGSIIKSIKDQVSGGELARFNLAIKSLTAKRRGLDTMVFDEIDTGVSGQTALEMGNVLKDTASFCQVICVTHSPQVASRAQQHYFVYKDHEKNNSTSNIKLLNQEEKIVELATMLSGKPPGKAALQNAKDLLTR